MITERQLAKYRGRQLNSLPKIETLKIQDLKMDKCQRLLDQDHAIKCIRRSGGIDWFKFKPVDVVRRSSGELTVIDGQNRLEMVRLVLPDLAEIPCRVIESDDPQVAASLFADFNARGIKRVKDTDLLWAEIIAGDQRARAIYQQLQAMHLRCDRVNALDDEGKHTGALNVDLAAVKRCLAWGPRETQRAVDLYRRAWPREQTVNGDVLTGLVRLLTFDHYRQDLAPSTQYGQNFDQWFVAAFQHLHPDRAKYVNYRNARQGWFDGVAWGLLEDFTSSQHARGRGAPRAGTLEQQHGHIGRRSR